MMKWVKFIDDNDEHRYETETGEWLQGVSTVSGVLPKEWLSAWGAKEAVKDLGYSDYEGDTEKAEKVLAEIKDMTVEQFQTRLKEAKGASRRKSKEALLNGTEGHAWLEARIKALIRGETPPELPDNTLKRPLEQFLEWERENIDEWVLSEARVADIENKYAGTLDALAYMKDGKLAIIDFKFASHISPEYFLQTAGYQGTLEKYGIKIDQRIIIRLPKTLYLDEWDEKLKKYVKVVNEIEPVVVPTPYEDDIRVFIAALPVKQWINRMTK